MGDDKDQASDIPKVFDINKPAKTAGSSDAKSISIASRPVLKEQTDADVASSNETGEVSSDTPTVKLQESSKIKISPIHDNVVPESDDKPEDESKPAENHKQPDTDTAEIDETKESSDVITDVDPKNVDGAAEPTKAAQEKIDEIAARKAAEHKAEIQKLALSRKFYLPINQVEKRRNKRVAWAGILLVILLAVAWGDIALDAGLVTIPGVKPVTHFFK